MDSEFKVRERREAVVLSKSLTVRLADLPAAIGSSFGQAYAHLGRLRVTSSDAPFVVYLGQPGPDDAPFDIQICAPVALPVEPPAGWTCVTLPAGQFASVVHAGPYETLGAAYDELTAWIGREGLAVAGPPREVYLTGPSTPAAETRTVVEFPVVPSTARTPVAVGR
jgi:effector-binding domain-containing protein